MSAQLFTVAHPLALSTTGLVSYLQGLFGPLFLGIVGIVAIFFLFTREIIRFRPGKSICPITDSPS